MKHGILLLSSYGLDYLDNFMQQFPKNDPDFVFYIHLDKLSRDQFNVANKEVIKRLFREYNVKYCGHINDSLRFSFTMAINMIEMLKISYRDCDYVHFMSESCYIKSIDEFKKKFENANNKSFMEYYLYDRFVYNLEIQYKGSQWMSLHRSLVQKIFEIKPTELNMVINKLRYHYILFFKSHYLKAKINERCVLTLVAGAPDEFLIQFIVIKMIFKNNKEEMNKYIVNDCLRYINWEQCTSSPRKMSYFELTDPKNPYKYDIEKIKNALIFRKIDYKCKDCIDFMKYIRTL